MLPESGNLLNMDLEIATQPSKTYRIDGGRIQGTVDYLEAVRQSVYCILNTERYDWLIYSWNYGTELKNLFEKPVGYVKSMLKRRIKEALMQDERITGVSDFTFEISGRKVSAAFVVHTDAGDIPANKEVQI